MRDLLPFRYPQVRRYRLCATIRSKTLEGGTRKPRGNRGVASPPSSQRAEPGLGQPIFFDPTDTIAGAIAGAIVGGPAGAIGGGIIGGLATSGLRAAAREIPEKLFHFGFSRNADSILKGGLRPGASGKVFTTTRGDLSPLQAQLDLALPPNRGLPDAAFEIDVQKLRRMGIDIPPVGQVPRSFNLPGGGTEVIFDHPIPPEAIRRIR